MLHTSSGTLRHRPVHCDVLANHRALNCNGPATMSQELQKLELLLEERSAQLEFLQTELDSLSFSISHDLCAPLRAIMGFAELLHDEHAVKLGAEGARQLEIIREQASRLNDMIGGLVSYSRLGRQQMNIAPVPMKSLAAEVFAELRAREPERSVEFELGDLPPARGDPDLLRIVWTKLLENALKFTRPRQAAVIAVEGAANAGQIVYVVRDNGVGFDPRFADRLFGMFQKMHREGAFEGVGAGLAVVRRLLHRHRGRTWAEAQPDQGARFFFALPAAPFHENAGGEPFQKSRS